MKVLVVGANGQIGQQLVDLLQKEESHEPIAMVRKDEQVKKFEEKGVQAVLADLEGPVEDLVEAVKEADAVVFTAGSGGSTGYDKTLLIDLDGAVKVMEAADKAGVNRFVMVSAMHAHNREQWSEEIKPYYVAKHYADRLLTESGLNYTILRPGGLKNEPGTGKISASEDLESGSIPREDVAKTIVAVLEEESTYNRSFDLVSGDTPIAEALKNL